MVKIGRNAPCPCGSGKKYKKCCMKNDQAAANPPISHHQKCLEVLNSLQGRIMRFVEKSKLDRELEAASLYYLAWINPDGPYQMDENETMPFLEWFIHDYEIPDEEKTIVQIFMDSNPRLPAEEMQVLESLQGSFISVYQITGVDQGNGFSVQDLFSDSTYQVSDETLSHKAKPGNLLVTRLTDVMGEVHASPAVSLSEGDVKTSFMRNIDSAFLEYQNEDPDAELADFLKARGFTLNSILSRTIANYQSSAPKIMTASGEEASFHQARYDLSDRDEALARFDQAPDFDPDEPGTGKAGEVSISWLETGESARLMQSIQGRKPLSNPFIPGMGEDGPMRLLGDIKMSGNKLLFNAMGQQRFELGKKRLESLLDGLVRHRLDSIQSMASAMAGRGQPGMGGGFKPLTPEPLHDIDPTDPNFAPLSPGESIQDALKNREFGSLEEANAFLQIASSQYNDRPQEELGGLSPAQVRNLMECDWEDPRGPIRLNKTLGLSELAHTPLLHNARLLLRLAQQKSGIKATGAGYLDTAAVRELILQGIWPERWAEEYQRKAEGRLREMDIRHVHALRLACSFSGLLEEKGGSFQLTHHGSQMLSEDYAGRLYKRLFFVLFQHLDLDIFDRHGLTYPDIQNGIAFSIYQLSLLKAAEWHVLAEVAPKLLLPAVKGACTSNEDHTQWNEYQIQGVVKNLGYRLIEPLEVCGLVETRDMGQPLLDLSTETEFKVTGLYGRFVSFTL